MLAPVLNVVRYSTNSEHCQTPRPCLGWRLAPAGVVIALEASAAAPAATWRGAAMLVTVTASTAASTVNSVLCLYHILYVKFWYTIHILYITINVLNNYSQPEKRQICIRVHALSLHYANPVEYSLQQPYYITRWISQIRSLIYDIKLLKPNSDLTKEFLVPSLWITLLIELLPLIASLSFHPRAVSPSPEVL